MCDRESDNAGFAGQRGQPAIAGKEAIWEHYRRLFADYRMELTVTSRETEIAGEWAFDRGRIGGVLRPRAGGGTIGIDDRYVALLRRRSDGGWEIAQLIWN